MKSIKLTYQQLASTTVLIICYGFCIWFFWLDANRMFSFQLHPTNSRAWYFFYPLLRSSMNPDLVKLFIIVSAVSSLQLSLSIRHWLGKKLLKIVTGDLS